MTNTTLVRDALAAMTKLQEAIRKDRYDEDDHLYDLLSEEEQDAWDDLTVCIEDIRDSVDSENSMFPSF